ncbi:MAG: SdrD B-like domain-containing protein, partial [Arenimonas sp.]
VTLTQVSTNNPGVTLDASTGAVNVAAGTPAGTYSLVYRICEALNPTNCDTATATVTVAAAPIDAVDDAGSVAMGPSAVTAVANVLVNDTLNGAAATLANVTLAQISTSNAGVTLDATTGAVNVAAGTPAGTYTLVYRICETLNPTNCDTATVTVTVTGGVADVYTLISIAPLGYVGEPINGHITFGNNGPDTADNVTYTMQLPTGLTGVSFSQPTGAPATMSFVYDPVTGIVTFTGLPTTLANGASFGMDYTFITPNLGQFEVSSTIATTTNESSGSNNAVAASAIILIADRQVVLNKVADHTEVSVGELIRYTIEVRNIGNLPALGLELVDTPAPGLSLVDGSLIVRDIDNAGVLIPGNPIRITGIDVPVGGTATVSYLMRVGAASSNGQLVNNVQATLDDDPISDVVTSVVRLGSDPMLDQSRILGKVFDDQDGDGWQDDGERGIPGVRLATVEGWVAETDAQGRYHFEGLVLSDRERGQNVLVKVDAATLPAGTLFTTENPLLRRVTAGVPVRFDFGARLPPRPQSMPPATLPASVHTLDQGMFEAGSDTFRTDAEGTLARIAAAIDAAHGGTLRLTGYAALGGSRADKDALSLRRGRAAFERIAAKLGAEAKSALQVEVEGADDAQGADR